MPLKQNYRNGEVIHVTGRRKKYKDNSKIIKGNE